ncbi:MAG: hypothetical protein IIA23_02765 [Chloroflexi bacterium]|nr:hypothetical protein [Chloroflexota bacterium]
MLLNSDGKRFMFDNVPEMFQGEFAETEERVKDAIASGVDPIKAHEQVNYDQMTQGR